MQARPLDAFASTLVFGLCIVWGFNQVAVKLALPDVGPIAQTGVRSGVGALCVIAYALFTRRRIFEIDGTEAAGGARSTGTESGQAGGGGTQVASASGQTGAAAQSGSNDP